jgi:hypothetical protein
MIEDPNPYLDPDPGGPKTYGSYGSGSAALMETNIIVSFVMMKCTEAVMNFRLLCLSLFIITSQLIKSSPFTSLWEGSVSVN